MALDLEDMLTAGNRQPSQALHETETPDKLCVPPSECASGPVLILARRFIDRINTRDTRALLDMFASEISLRDSGVEVERQGASDAAAFFERQFKAYPDNARQIASIYPSGNTVIVTWDAKTSEQEPFLFGRMRTVRIEYRGVSILSTHNDRITALDEYYDRAASHRYAFALTLKPLEY